MMQSPFLWKKKPPYATIFMELQSELVKKIKETVMAALMRMTEI